MRAAESLIEAMFSLVTSQKEPEGLLYSSLSFLFYKMGYTQEVSRVTSSSGVGVAGGLNRVAIWAPCPLRG